MSLFILQLRGELQKMLARRRTFIGFGAFLALDIVLIWVFHRPNIKHWFSEVISNGGGAFDFYYSATTLGFFILGASTFLLGGLYLALVGGDVVAKETEDGTLRLVLSRPITRLRVLALKYTACLIYTVFLMFFISISALLAIACVRGFNGGFFAFTADQKVFSLFPEVGESYLRYGFATLCLSLGMCTVTSIAFFFSCLKIKPAAATIMTLSYVFLDFILHNMPFMKDYKGYFITTHIEIWARSCELRIPWADLIEGYSSLAAINLTLFVAGWVAFQSRDFKS